jgi:hypothetical protein
MMESATIMRYVAKVDMLEHGDELGLIDVRM